MKKTTLSLAFYFCLLFAAHSQIVITEIMYNPPESGADSLEFIELYNNSGAAVNMENWTTFGVVFTFPAVTVQPGGYLLLSINATALQNQFGVSSLQWTGNALSNGGETIKVINSSGVVVDSVAYDDAAPWPTMAAGGGASIVLCNYNSDNNQAVNWQAAGTPTGVTINGTPVFANPGAASGCATVLSANDDIFTAAFNQASTIFVLSNDNIPDPANTMLNIIAPPSSGIAAVNPDNSVTYTPNTGYCGGDAFSYRLCDPNGCDTAAVSISIPCYPPYSIAQVTGEDANGIADSLDVYCELTGIVYGVNTRASATGAQFTLIDANNEAGINVFSPASTFGYTVKESDRITVRGYIEQFNGLTEIVPQQILLVSSNTVLASPLVVLKPDETTESRLIRINNLRLVDTLQWTSVGNPSGFNAQAVSDAHPQDTIIIRVDNDVDLYNQPAPPQPFDITGIGGQFDDTSPYTDGYQIAPRYTPDISTLVRVKEADFSAFVRLAPNPVSDKLLLQTDVLFERVRIFAASGVLVKKLEKPAQTQEIEVSTLSPGTYFIQFEKDGAVWVKCFVKM